MNAFLKKKFVGKYSGKPASALLVASPVILKGVSQRNASTWAKRHQIKTVGDLIGRWPFPPELQIGIDPSLIESIICHVYPRYDAGPPCGWTHLFGAAPLEGYVTHPSGRFRAKFGPVFYRGRLDGTARVLIVGQDPSTDEIIAHRILVGDAGQKLQGLLTKLGLTRSYVMLNTFLFGIEGQFDSQMESIALEAPVLDYRNKLFDRVASENRLEAILAFGKGAHFSVDHWPGKANQKVVEFVHPTAPENVTLADWNAKLKTARALVKPDGDGHVDPNPYGQTFAADDPTPIPRYDLPFGIPAWHGTHGTRSHRLSPVEIAWTAV